jgi:hypothetical protein
MTRELCLLTVQRQSSYGRALLSAVPALVNSVLHWSPAAPSLLATRLPIYYSLVLAQQSGEDSPNSSSPTLQNASLAATLPAPSKLHPDYTLAADELPQLLNLHSIILLVCKSFSEFTNLNLVRVSIKFYSFILTKPT